MSSPTSVQAAGAFTWPLLVGRACPNISPCSSTVFEGLQIIFLHICSSWESCQVDSNEWSQACKIPRKSQPQSRLVGIPSTIQTQEGSQAFGIMYCSTDRKAHIFQRKSLKPSQETRKGAKQTIIQRRHAKHSIHTKSCSKSPNLREAKNEAPLQTH